MTLAALLLSSVPPAMAHVPFPAPPARRSQCGSTSVPALCRLHWWVRRTWSLQDARSQRRTRYWFTAERNPDQAPWLERRIAWRARAYRVALIPLAPWPPGWLQDALCVHHYEGAWNDPNAPYYGGMQEDMTFQQAYGPEFLARYGTADHWPPHDQLVAAFRAWRVRGWEPWPQTASVCGLL